MRHCIIIAVIGISAFHNLFCQTLTKEQKEFLKENFKTIHETSLQSQPTWDFILPQIQNKKIILLGEFNHGSKEIFELHNSLIKYLHQKTGVKVLLLESGIGELITADLERDQITPSQMTNGLFGGWRTKEFTELMEYVKSQNISIAGFDVQRTGGSFTYVLNTMARKYNLDTMKIYDLEQRYGSTARELTNKRAVYDSLSAKTIKLIQDYKIAKDELSAHLKKEKTRDLLFTVVAIENRIQFLSYQLRFLKDKNWSARWAARDSAMAKNMIWLIDNVYKNQTVIVIAHNYHIGSYNENETVMGEILKAKYKTKMYSIGFFAGSGTYTDNFDREVKMTPPDSIAQDIKHFIAELHNEASFVSIPGKFSKGSDWLNQNIIINDTFIDLNTSNKMNLSKTFDGLIFLKRVSPPVKK